MGVAAIFGPGTETAEIVKRIHEIVHEKGEPRTA
jgi:methylmalonyl-CoA mutase cobalamin-binding subunit